MKHERIAGLRLFYDPAEQEAARVIGMAMEKSTALLAQRWGLAPPPDCRVYVMTSWMGFLFQSAPWAWKAYLTLVLPLLYWRASETWAYSGGWALQFGRRLVVGIKPPRLMQTAGRGLGEQFYTGDMDINEKVQTITCHELTQAFTYHLRLPTWLHEGLATLSMEHYLGRQVVKSETLEYLAHPSLAGEDRGVKKERVRNPSAHAAKNALLRQYALGYWLARYIEETRPELLQALLSRKMERKELEERIAAALGKERERFWEEIGETLRNQYS